MHVIISRAFLFKYYDLTKKYPLTFCDIHGNCQSAF